MNCDNGKWVKLIYNNNKTVNLMEKDGFDFIGFDKHEVNGITYIQEISGVDGALMGVTTFGPFELNLHFRYTGVDSTDMDLFCFELENEIQSREPYYVVHSKMPGIKYFVAPTPKVEKSPITLRHSDFTITFTCNKGYSESLYETNQYDKTSDKWQFGNGLLVNDDIKYKHNTTSFKIFNGSSDTIRPFPHRHKLIIKLNVNAPNGFKLQNRTTGDVFQYKKAIKSNQQLIINGVYPTINGKRVGIDTNHEWLSLAPGYNDIEIIGTDITQPTAEFIFPFIYR
ncbi:phage tail domain-containing protein [Mammaliicoccus sciuri]|uniref:phage tail domain-containing protein n=1 Tax=Mammaliicoccus sciuri TaxID=1296 RepID=UPI001FB4EFD1|nr:phage tail domain-containing protein [Mammaliicoccus sciuri]MCJ1780383.1 phage tail family protein [Mammaliicoccus sciuri]